MNALEELKKLTGAELLQRIETLAANERANTLDLLWSLAALEANGSLKALGYDGLFTYCHKALRMPESTASRYWNAATLLARFPIANDYLADGRLSPTTLRMLGKVLTEENQRTVFEQASNLSQRETEWLIAKLAPRADIKESVRFPTRRAAELIPMFDAVPAQISEPQRPVLRVEATVTRSTSAEPIEKVGARELNLPESWFRPSVEVKPLREGRCSVRANITKETLDALYRVQSALSHSMPHVTLGDALTECVRRTDQQLATRKHGSLKARSKSTTRTKTSTVEVHPHASRQATTSTIEATADSSHATSTSTREAADSTPLASQTTSTVEVDAESSLRASTSTAEVQRSSARPASLATSTVEVHAATATTSTMEVERNPPRSPLATSTVEVAPPTLDSIQQRALEFLPRWLRGKRAPSIDVKREVWRRDGGSCSFVGSTGHRCGSTWRLEYDHWRAHALGGEPTVDNIRLLCRSHNLHCAVETFGPEFMARFVRSLKPSSGSHANDAAPPSPESTTPYR